MRFLSLGWLVLNQFEFVDGDRKYEIRFDKTPIDGINWFYSEITYYKSRKLMTIWIHTIIDNKIIPRSDSFDENGSYYLSNKVIDYINRILSLKVFL